MRNIVRGEGQEGNEASCGPSKARWDATAALEAPMDPISAPGCRSGPLTHVLCHTVREMPDRVHQHLIAPTNQLHAAASCSSLHRGNSTGTEYNIRARLRPAEQSAHWGTPVSTHRALFLAIIICPYPSSLQEAFHVLFPRFHSHLDCSRLASYHHASTTHQSRQRPERRRP